MNEQTVGSFVVGTCNFERFHETAQSQLIQAGTGQIYMLITPSQLFAVDSNVAVLLLKLFPFCALELRIVRPARRPRRVPSM